jgi:predicted lactoylglutathione lyase
MRQIFVNLPVKDLERSKKFFASLGFSFNPQFTDENAACMVVEKDAIHVMLLAEAFFKTFTPRAIVAKATKAGGKPVREPQDHGFMYQHAFEDPDGHIWELVHMRSQPQ